MTLLAEETTIEPEYGVLALAPADPPRAQVAECNCPEFCERDHSNE